MEGAPVVVVGAGPAGLATAACLRREGVPFRLLDRRGAPGGAYLRIHDGVTLASPARYTTLPHEARPIPTEYVTVPAYRDYLLAYARGHDLVPERRSVEHVSRDGAGFLLRLDGGEAIRAPALVLATGLYDHPRRPAIEGLAESGLPVIHASEWRGPSLAAGPAGGGLARAGPAAAGPLAGTWLVVGGATSAIEIAEESAAAGVPVIVSARSGVHVWRQRLFGRDLHDYLFALERLPRALLGRFCEDRPTAPGTDLGFSRHSAAGRIETRGALARFDGPTACFVDGSRRQVDAVVLATGYAWRAPYLPDEVARARAGHPRATRSESVSWPGLYLVGAPCAHRINSDLLRGIGADAPLVARAIAERLQGAA